jgi:Lar family restriction alleviation protein
MTELKPCPFCGSEANEYELSERSIDCFDALWLYKFTVICEKCGCRTDKFNQPAEAIEAWNRRVAE